MHPQCPTWEALFRRCSVYPPMTQVPGSGPREAVVGKPGVPLPYHQGLGQALGGLLVVFHGDLREGAKKGPRCPRCLQDLLQSWLSAGS